jgi:hypothetical protein
MARSQEAPRIPAPRLTTGDRVWMPERPARSGAPHEPAKEYIGAKLRQAAGKVDRELAGVCSDVGGSGGGCLSPRHREARSRKSTPRDGMAAPAHPRCWHAGGGVRGEMAAGQPTPPGPASIQAKTSLSTVPAASGAPACWRPDCCANPAMTPRRRLHAFAPRGPGGRDLGTRAMGEVGATTVRSMMDSCVFCTSSRRRDAERAPPRRQVCGILDRLMRDEASPEALRIAKMEGVEAAHESAQARNRNRGLKSWSRRQGGNR